VKGTKAIIIIMLIALKIHAKHQTFLLHGNRMLMKLRGMCLKWAFKLQMDRYPNEAKFVL